MNQIWFISANVWRNPKYPHPEFFSKKKYFKSLKTYTKPKKKFKKKKKKKKRQPYLIQKRKSGFCLY
jgi:hypothetical protein